MKKYPKIIIVSKENNYLGVEEFPVAIKKCLIRQIARILVFNSKGDIFLQRRGLSTPIFPGFWENSASGHVDEGETIKEAAFRELEEETGMVPSSLEKVNEGYYEEVSGDLTLKCYETIYFAKYDGETKIDGEEVLEGKWVPLEKIYEKISLEMMAPGLIRSIELAKKYKQ